MTSPAVLHIDRQRNCVVSPFGDVYGFPTNAKIVTGAALPPVCLITMDELHQSLRGSWSHDGYPEIVRSASPDGFIRLDTPSDHYVWEVYPVDWAQGSEPPYSPETLYLAVWPD